MTGVVLSHRPGWPLGIPLSPPEGNDDVLCGLAVYSSDLVPLGHIAKVAPTRPPNPTVRYVLDGNDLVVSESMIFHAEPTEDRVILNLSARRVVRAVTK